MKRILYVLFMLVPIFGCMSMGASHSTTPPTVANSSTSPTTWDPSYGGADKSYDTGLLTLREAIAPKFKTLVFRDAATGRFMEYSLYVPENYDPRRAYPLVLFMADASTTGKGVKAPLMQGYGGIIWATEESQAKNPSFVLVPSFKGPDTPPTKGPVAVVNDDWEVTEEVGVALRLLGTVVSQYNVDKDRIYTTGQSMGGMLSFYFNTNYPDLFAASIFVGSQWNIKTLEPLQQMNFFYIVSAGDAKASVGMREVGEMLKSKGTNFGQIEFSARLPSDEQVQRVRNLLKEGYKINFVQFSKGTVVPPSVANPGAEHMYSFDYAYQLAPVREWVFRQSRRPDIRHRIDSVMLNLGIKHLADSDRDYIKAMEYFNIASALGHMKAPRYLGIIHEDGLGIKIDYSKAMAFYMTAAKAGDITAAARIGWLYERGFGVAQDYRKAVEWYLTAAPSPEEAAQNVHPRLLALLRLGYLYEKGIGVEKNVNRAIAWYRVAAQDNSAEAVDAVSRLQAGMK